MCLSGENVLSWKGKECAKVPWEFPWGEETEKKATESGMGRKLNGRRKLPQTVFLKFSLERFPMNSENVCGPVFVPLLGIQDF